MTRSIALIDGIAALVAAAGLTLLARPAAVRALLGLSNTGQARYALRILGAMLFAAALFAGGFATAFQLAVQP